MAGPKGISKGKVSVVIKKFGGIGDEGCVVKQGFSKETI
jgi:hypothetical protein